MRVLIIGGTGIISTAIVDRLHDAGQEPILFNRGKTPKRYKRDAEVIVGDRREFADFAEKMRSVKVDAVIDMITFDPATAANAIEVFSGRISQYVFCSTCAAIGKLTHLPGRDDEPHRPTGTYGINKSKAEAEFMTAYRQSGFPVTILRPAYTFGPGITMLDIWGMDAAIISRIRDKRPIVVPGDGEGLIQASPATDVAKGFVGVLKHEKTKGESYNIVNDEFMTWREYFERLARAIGFEAEIATMTMEQIKAGTPPEKAWFLEMLQGHSYHTNERLKADVPEFGDFDSFEKGVQGVVEWMDQTGAHRPSDSQPWVDALVRQEVEFRKQLKANTPPV